MLYGCGACGGLWLDNQGSRAVLVHADASVFDLAWKASQHATVAVERRPAGLPCAECGAAMQRVVSPQGHVELDVCPEHGTWFDKDELSIVARGAELARRATAVRAQDLSLAAAATNPGDALEQRAVAGGFAAAAGVLGAFLALAAVGSSDSS